MSILRQKVNLAPLPGFLFFLSAKISAVLYAVFVNIPVDFVKFCDTM
jgi:hypothetical protein